MAGCLNFSQGSRTWLALLVPVYAVFAKLSPGHGTLWIPITFISLSTIFLLNFSKRKPIMLVNSLLKEVSLAENELKSQEIHQPFADCSVEQGPKGKAEDSLMGSQDLYSESESMDQLSSSYSENECCDMEWAYDMGERMDWSVEESLIEIAIPSGQFDKDLSLRCCKLSHQENMFPKDLLAEVNEEDNLIEIDINIGSIKCSSFQKHFYLIGIKIELVDFI